MNRLVQIAFGIAIVCGMSVSALVASQGQPQAPRAVTAPAKQEVFCEGMSAGQLCPTGSSAILKLDGAKKDHWVAATKKYNQAVDAATKAFLADAKTTLSPEEYAGVEKWFAKGVNAYINQQLLSTPR